MKTPLEVLHKYFHHFKSERTRDIVIKAMEDYAEIYKECEVKKLNKPAVSGSVLKINLHEYGYSCGDGCCYNYGTVTTVNGNELPCHNQDAATILSQVLEHLGYTVEMSYSDDVS